MPGSETKTYRAACVQFNVALGDVDQNLDAAVMGVRDAVQADAQLCVLPEMWTTSFVPDPSDQLLAKARRAEETLQKLTKELSIMTIGGGYEQQSDRLYNHARVDDCGKLLGIYRKIHMFSPNAEDRHVSPGEQPLVLDTRLGRIGVILCYDIRFPELTRYHFHKGVQVLAVPAQWPEARADHWRTLLRARAIENQCYILGCNRIGTEDSLRSGEPLVFPGDSRIFDPMGDSLATGQGETQSISAEIQLRRCRSMRRILPIHQDRQPSVYRDMWQPIWENPDEPKAPDVPTIERASPTKTP